MYRRFIHFCLLLLALLVVQGRGQGAEPAYDGKSVPHWQAALKNTDAKVRRRAAYALGQIGPAAMQAVPELSGALADRQLEVAWYAADALGRVGPAAAPATKALIGVIEESPGDAVLRRNAVIALGRIGSKTGDVLPVLEKLLKSDDAETRVAAGVALFQITGQDAMLMLVAKELKPARGAGSIAAALALRGHVSAPVAAALIEVLDSSDADLRRAATESLGHGGAAAILPLVLAIQDHAPPRSRQASIAAIEALGLIADAGRKEVDAVFFHDPPGPYIQSDTRTLIHQRLVPSLIARLADPDDQIQATAARSLAKVGSEAIPALLAALLGENARRANGARMALSQIKPYLPAASGAIDFAKQEQVLKQLIAALSQRDPAIRAAGFRLFAELGIGKSGAAAADALRAGLSDPNADIRRHAAAALARLETN